MTATTIPPLPTSIYTTESPLAHPGKLWREMLSDLWTGRELAWRLAPGGSRTSAPNTARAL